MKYIVCVDDEPERYSKLLRYCIGKYAVVVVLPRPKALGMYLDINRAHVLGVCLDGNMGFGERDGFWVVEEYLKRSGIPVAVVTNHHGMSETITEKLQEHGVPVLVAPFSTGTSWVENIVDFFEECEDG